jgi:hypothetical protein
MFEIIRASGLILVAYSDLSIGMMFAMFGYIWFIMTPVQDILSMQYSYASAMSAIKRINKILTLRTEKSGDKNIESKKLQITLKDLNFAYSNEKPILKNISLTIEAGCSNRGQWTWKNNSCSNHLRLLREKQRFSKVQRYGHRRDRQKFTERENLFSSADADFI